MTAPAFAAQCLLAALGIGMGLGAFCGFLRPLRPAMTWLADLVFVGATLWGWIYLTFGICGGDSRIGCTLILFIGVVLWECTLGRLLRPVWRRFWWIILWPWGKIRNIFQKFYIFLLAIGKKWFTIVGTMKTNSQGGADHGKNKPSQAGAAEIQPRHKSRHRVRRHPFAGGSGGTVRHH